MSANEIAIIIAEWTALISLPTCHCPESAFVLHIIQCRDNGIDRSEAHIEAGSGSKGDHHGKFHAEVVI